MRSFAATGSAGAGQEIEISPLCFWTVWESRDSVLIAVQVVEREPRETRDLLRLQRRLTLHFFRLLGLERLLSARAQLRRGRGGRKAVRQIEMERQRLGRELHTGVGQGLAAIRLQLEVIAAELPSPPGSVRQALANISTLAADTMEQVRGLSRRLHPPEWQRLTLGIRDPPVVGDQRCPAALRGFPPDRSLTLGAAARSQDSDLPRIAGGALQPGAALARPRGSPWPWRSVTANWSSAFAIMAWDSMRQRMFSAPASVASGIGLRSIRETAQELGGRLEVESGPDGTKLVVSVAPFPVES